MYTVEIDWKNTGFKYANTRFEAETFTDAIELADDTVLNMELSPARIDIFQNDKLIASLRILR